MLQAFLLANLTPSDVKVKSTYKGNIGGQFHFNQDLNLKSAIIVARQASIDQPVKLKGVLQQLEIIKTGQKQYHQIFKAADIPGGNKISLIQQFGKYRLIAVPLEEQK